MSDTPRPSGPDLTNWHIGRLISVAAHVLEHAVDTEISRLGITHAGFRVLDVLAAGPLPQHELARRCHVRDQTLSRIVDRLERAGYVVRRRDEKDRRRILVHRTAEGEGLLERARTLAAARLAPVAEAADDVAACRRLLIKIIKGLGHERRG